MMTGGGSVRLNEHMESKKLTVYRLSKESGVPYTTVSDLCNNKVNLRKCSAETLYRLAKALGVSMESLIEPDMEQRCDFELFKSNVCHRLKTLGDTAFLIELLEQDKIRLYHKKKWFPESLYLLAMLDYLSRLSGIALCTRYDDLRNTKLGTPLYPASVLALAAVTNSEEQKRKAIASAIPEFIRFNIVECEVRNVT